MTNTQRRKISPVAQEAVAHYLAQSEALNSSFAEPSIVAVRREAQALFSETAFPTLRDENWQYTKLTDFVQKRFKVLNKTRVEHGDLHSFLPPFSVVRIVFVDGWFDEELSDDLASLPMGVTVESTRDVFEMPDAAQRLFTQQEQVTKEPFGVLNTALVADGYYLQVETNTIVETPIMILNVQTQNNHMSSLRHHVVMDAHSELTLVEQYVSLDDSPLSCTNVVNEISIAEGARLNQVIVQQQNRSGYYFNNQFVTQAAHSGLNTFYAGVGSLLSRHQNHVALNGDGIETIQNSACYASDKQIVDSRTSTGHNQLWGVSQQLHKFVLDDAAVGVFDGMIRVDQQAQKTDGQMDNKNLLLSDAARMNSKPQLEIYADDVKCSHGAATGQMDANQVFYMQARGIEKQQAVAMITNAFLVEPAEAIKNNDIKAWIVALLSKQLRSQSVQKVVEKVSGE